MTETRSFYRGASAVDLAETANLEDVSRLLWRCEDFDPFEQTTAKLPSRWVALQRASADCSALERATMLLPVIEAANPRVYDLFDGCESMDAADFLPRRSWAAGSCVPR